MLHLWHFLCSGQNWATCSVPLSWTSMDLLALRKTQTSLFFTSSWSPVGRILTRTLIPVWRLNRSVLSSRSFWLSWAPTKTYSTRRCVLWTKLLWCATRTVFTCWTTYWSPTPGSWLTMQSYENRKFRQNQELSHRMKSGTEVSPDPR